jgi:hypothetical protein
MPFAAPSFLVAPEPPSRSVVCGRRQFDPGLPDDVSWLLGPKLSDPLSPFRTSIFGGEGLTRQDDRDIAGTEVKGTAESMARLCRHKRYGLLRVARDFYQALTWKPKAEACIF